LTAGPRAVLFDLDDTLYPEREFVDGGFHAVARLLAGLTGRSEADLTERLWTLHLRDGRGRLFDSLLAELGLDTADAGDLIPACLLVYRAHPTALTASPGAEVSLERLRARGLRTGVISDGNAAVQSRKLAGLPAIVALLDLVVLTEDLGPGHAKPSPVPFQVACRLLDVAPSATIYVGNDPRKDFVGARSAGLRTIRIGPLPDEGGPTAITVETSQDADLAVDSFDALDRTIAGMTT
jgi:putative hydrolase of the HAD superfamily